MLAIAIAIAIAIARALVSSPRLLLLDEPSLGLAPIVTQGLFRVLEDVNREAGTATLVVEQNAHLALDIGATAFVLQAGRVVTSGPAAQMQQNEDVRQVLSRLLDRLPALPPSREDTLRWTGC